MSETCGRLRRQLDAYLDRELPLQTRSEIEGHLAGCAECAAEAATRVRLRAQLQTAVRAVPVPDGLQAKVRHIPRGQTARPHAGLWAVAAAVAVVIICAALFNLWRAHTNPVETILRKTSGRLAAVLNVGLRDHLQCAVFRKYSKQPVQADKMAADLGPEFAGLAPLVQAKLPTGFRIIQGHRCSAGGRQYTHFIVSGGGKLISLILTRKQSGEALGSGIYQTGVDRFQVVGLESHGYLCYVISDLDAQQNLQWAANLAPTLRKYLTAHPA